MTIKYLFIFSPAVKPLGQKQLKLSGSEEAQWLINSEVSMKLH